MRLRYLVFVALLATAAAQSVNPAQQYIQTCTGIGTSKITCQYVPLSTIQIPGPKGDPGTNGTNATATVGTVSTLPPGSPATVTNSGTPSSAVFNFGIPAGQNGAIGPPGPIIPGLTYTANPDGTTTLTLNGSFTTTGGLGVITLDGMSLTCTAAGPKCQ